ncbi:sulfite oxidase heme-binding subunit YedZ [Chloroflexus sp.]|uniref:sulfite oxidase heme-binding subunit YedZ n=1 Tax=Chloroflexus sp. TaxID=1904827 RepID=UPI00263902A2|nr:protein-methionine-sulfoxide reductase heme-binding subunit MsrQ [uncultured Chloroflexus sp.]
MKSVLLRLFPHLIGLLPLALLSSDALGNRLTVNPIQYLTQRTGWFALALLLATLACTPLNRWFGWKQVIRWRRPLGLYSFGYACLHLGMFAGLDYGLDLSLIAQEVVEKRYIIAGFGAFLILFPLAFTSTTGWQRRLKHWWKRLHRLVYLAAFLAVVHYLWLSKDPRPALIAGSVLVVLLLARRMPARRRVQPSLRHPDMTTTQAGQSRHDT